MAAVSQPPYLLPGLKLVEADGAEICDRPAPDLPVTVKDVVDENDREDFLDEDGGCGGEIRRGMGVGVRIGPGDVGFEEASDAGGGEGAVDEAAKEAEEEDEVDEDFGEEEFGVADGKPHGWLLGC